jgi:hypothetical protein
VIVEIDLPKGKLSMILPKIVNNDFLKPVWVTLPISTINTIRKHASERGITMNKVVREWVLERYEQDFGGKND